MAHSAERDRYLITIATDARTAEVAIPGQLRSVNP